MKTINIKGKEYVEVKERILYLAETYPNSYSIESDYTYYPERKLWVVKAQLTISKGDKSMVYVGHAQEIESGNYKEVNATSALENCETSAVGRACAMAGIGVIESIASADEVHKAINRQPQIGTSSQPQKSTGLLPCDKCGGTFQLRKGPKSEFYGCSGWKAKGCKRTLSLDEAMQWTQEGQVQQVFSDGVPLPTYEG